ncbi:MAG TPA: hypothetical protein VNA12_05555 [Mycobacteriales bacterium]|nr:hypothetical protein [Mycobacteriales bacterium]
MSTDPHPAETMGTQMSYTGDEEYVTGVMRPPRRWPFAVGAAVLLAAAAVAGVLVAERDDDPTPRAVASPSPTPEESPSPSPTPSPTPTPEDSPTPSTSPTPAAAPTPTVTRSAARTPAATRVPTPRPTPTPAVTRTPQPSGYPARGLVLEVSGEPVTGDPPGVTFRIRVRDNDGNEIDGTIDYGDGTRQVYSRRPSVTCTTRPTATPPPGYRPAPVDRRFTVTHYYQAGGRYTVTVTATTGRQCFGTPVESTRRHLVVVVPPRPTASSSPQPTPVTATPTPTPPATEGQRP